MNGSRRKMASNCARCGRQLSILPRPLPAIMAVTQMRTSAAERGTGWRMAVVQALHPNEVRQFSPDERASLREAEIEREMSAQRHFDIGQPDVQRRVVKLGCGQGDAMQKQLTIFMLAWVGVAQAQTTESAFYCKADFAGVLMYGEGKTVARCGLFNAPRFHHKNQTGWHCRRGKIRDRDCKYQCNKRGRQHSCPLYERRECHA